MLERFDLTPCETLAIGDSDNDLKMFQFVSHAVPMKNAPDHVKVSDDDINGIYL
jgi:hydroxymethylpyrimidine pyrophosphatase-like HAD family hydrolase